MKRDSLGTMVGSAMGLRLAMAALNYGLFWLLSHRLSTEALGGFSLLMSVFLLVQVLPLLGLQVPLIRRAASEPGRLDSEFSVGLAIALPVGVLLAAAIVAVALWAYPPQLELPFFLLAAAVLPGAWILVAESCLLGMERMVVMARVQCAEVLARVVGAVVLVEMGHGLAGVFAMVLLLRCLVVLAYARLPWLPRPSRALVTRALLRERIAEIPVFFGIALLATLATRLDVILLSRLQGLEQVGIYAAAARLYDAALMLPTVAALAMMPALARLFADDAARFGELLQATLRRSLAGGVLVALAVAACAHLVIGLLYKPEMAPAAAVLRCLIFAAVLMTADQILSSTMVAAKAQQEDMKALARGLVVLVAGLLLLGWAWGPLGAAAAVLAAQVCRVSLRIRWARTALGLPGLWPEWRRQLLAATAGVAGLLAGMALPVAWDWLAAWALAWAAWALAARAGGLVGPDWRQRLAGWWRAAARRARA